jgi:hypothetical protein
VKEAPLSIKTSSIVSPSAVPSAAGGEVHVTCVSLTNTALCQPKSVKVFNALCKLKKKQPKTNGETIPPKEHCNSLELTKLVPVIETTLPPTSGPEAGTTVRTPTKNVRTLEDGKSGELGMAYLDNRLAQKQQEIQRCKNRTCCKVHHKHTRNIVGLSSGH